MWLPIGVHSLSKKKQGRRLTAKQKAKFRRRANRARGFKLGRRLAKSRNK